MAPLVGLYRQVQPPSGAHLALACTLVPGEDDPRHELHSHVVTANNNALRIYSVTRRHEHARLEHLVTRKLHGTVSSLARMSLMEWSPAAHDLVPVSLHTFEKLPQVADDRATLMAVDPASRLAALLLPTNSGGDGTLALLPFFADDLDLDELGMDRDAWEHQQGTGGSIPYAPSHLVPLSSLTSPTAASSSLTAARSSTLPSATASTASNAFLPGAATPPVRNVVSMAFLPGFTEPTLALLYAPEWTWSGRLEHLAHNYLVSLITLTTSTSGSSSSTRATVISTSPPLPYSCLSLAPCPPHIGGVLLLTANGALHVDQSGRVVACAANAWLPRDFPPGRARPTGLDAPPQEGVREALDGARLAWLDHAADADSDAPDDAAAGAGTGTRALVLPRSGRALLLSLSLTGRAVSSLALAPLADVGKVTGAGASALVRVCGGREGGLVFVGSESGACALLRWGYDEEGEGAETGSKEVAEVGVRVEQATSAPPQLPARKDADEVEMDFDEDDIYGDSSPSVPTLPSSAALADLASLLAGAPGAAAGREEGKGRVVLRIEDTIGGYGAVRGMVMGLVDDESPAQLVAATGAGKSAGLTIFHRTLYPVARRAFPLPSTLEPAEDVPPFVATGGLWRVQLAPRAGGGEAREVWVASDAKRSAFYAPSPATGALEVVRLSPADEPPILAAGSLGRGAALVTVSRDALRVYSADLLPQQTLPLPHALDPRAHAPHTSFGASCVAVHVPVGAGARARTAPLVWRWSGDAEGGALHPVLLEGERDAGARAAVFEDRLRRVPLVRPAVRAQSAAALNEEEADAEIEDDLYGLRAAEEETPQEKAGEDERAKVLEGEEPHEWEVEVGAGGDLRIRLLPSGDEIFSSSAVSLFPDVLEDGVTDRVLPEGIDEDDVKLDRVSVAYLGPAGRETLHLFILLTNGQLAVYEAFASLSAVSPVAPSSARVPRLAARFVKTLVRHVPSAPLRRKGASAADLPPPKRDFVAFAALAGAGAAVLLTGEEAVWVVKGAHGPARAVENAERGVYAAVELGGEQQHEERGGEEGGSEMVLQTREGCFIARLPRALTLDAPIPYTHVPKDRVYAHLAFDLESGLYAGATLNETRFVAFDEEGQPLWKDHDPNLIEPTNYRSTLELLTPGSWQAIHGYEFRQNEFVTSLKSVSLASRSTPTGQRDFVAVGTAVYRAEDLATKGGIYVFEIIPVNPHPSTPHLTHQFRLLFFEDAKAAVNNVCDLNGYLFLSMGQKLYARAFEQDEFLLAVGFLDVGVHVKSLTALKNFLLIGDEQQSISLVAFQEDPYKLVLLGRDYRPSRVGGANFIVNEGKVAFVSNDDAGVLRLFEYDPTNIASYAGQRLMCRTEFNAGSESHASLLFARHAPGEDAKQNGILYGALDGSLSTLVPVRDAVFRRLQSLQATMTRHVLHFGGLNPRGYRIVKNDSVSRAIVKGILDGDLLGSFEALPLEYQNELAGAVGTDADTVRANLRNLRGFE
ncbi:mRNA cleavage and polyadenylation factor subunit [Rhodotorula kratochvilovae]